MFTKNSNKLLCLTLVAFILLSCDKNKWENRWDKEDKLKYKFVNNNNVQISKKKPVFLTLNPEMTESEFENEIDSLNKSGKLENGEFVTRIYNAIWDFNVYKDKKSINLSYNDEYRGRFLNSENTKKVIKRYENDIKKFLKVFSEKTTYREYTLDNLFNLDREPGKSTFSKYLGYNSRYRILRDSLKTVFLSYFAIDGDNSFELQTKSNTYETRKKQVITLSIHLEYYRNKDFDSIIKSMQKEIIKKEDIQDSIRTIEREKRRKRKNNTDNF